ncbi:MAG: hypothetical protein ACRD4D_06390 [Candidatus Acidiferrales bacterium]
MGLKERAAPQLVCVLALLSALSTPAWEKKMKLEQLPAAVRETVVEASRGLKLRVVTREVKNGETFYEAELEVDGHIRDVIIDANGAIVLVEEEVAWERLPAAVRAAIEKGAEGGKILHVESLTRNDVIEAYEGHVRKWWRKIEIRVDPEGNPIEAK